MFRSHSCDSFDIFSESNLWIRIIAWSRLGTLFGWALPNVGPLGSSNLSLVVGALNFIHIIAIHAWTRCLANTWLILGAHCGSFLHVFSKCSSLFRVISWTWLVVFVSKIVGSLSLSHTHGGTFALDQVYEIGITVRARAWRVWNLLLSLTSKGHTFFRFTESASRWVSRT